MTDRELLKEARDLIVMCGLLDKSGQCEAMADKIDKQLSIANVSDMLCGSFEPDNSTSSATKCKCGREKWEHPKPRN